MAEICDHVITFKKSGSFAIARCSLKAGHDSDHTAKTPGRFDNSPVGDGYMYWKSGTQRDCTRQQVPALIQERVIEAMTIVIEG